MRIQSYYLIINLLLLVGSNKGKETIKERGQIRFRRIGSLSSNTPEKNKDTSIASTTSEPTLKPELKADEEAIKEKTIPNISKETQSEKIKNAITENIRTVAFKPTIEGVDYEIHYDEKNKWYYIDATNFGLNPAENLDDTEALNKALKATNEIKMADPSGTRYTGVAVKLSGIVNIARDRGEIDHYEILTYGSGVPMPIRGGEIDGIQFSYQTNILIEGTTTSENGHKLNGSTGYGFASESGSYNNGIVFRNNTSTYNYRKGLDIHDGDRILIENNVSYGDRLLGISVYNRNFKMENVIIRNNIITQDKTNRLAKDDLKVDGKFTHGHDYLQYEAIHLQTNEKSQDLSEMGSVGYFEISNNRIQNLDSSGRTATNQDYNTNAILVRMQEPYLNYVLNIKNNQITGHSANDILKMINSSNDNIKGTSTLSETNKFANGLGYGSGSINISGNKVELDELYGDPNKDLSAITIAESTINSNVTDQKLRAAQDKFRGSVTFENNDIKIKKTFMSTRPGIIGKQKKMPVISITTNSEAILFKDNNLDFGEVTQTLAKNIATLSPLISLNGNNGTLIQPGLGFNANTSRTPSNLPNTLSRTQPLVFLGNDIKISGISYANNIDLPLLVLETSHLVRYTNNNTFTSDSEITASVTDTKTDPLENSIYTSSTERVTPSKEKNSSQFNMGISRISTASPILLDSKEEVVPYDTVYINDNTIAAGTSFEKTPGREGKNCR